MLVVVFGCFVGELKKRKNRRTDFEERKEEMGIRVFAPPSSFIETPNHMLSLSSEQRNERMSEGGGDARSTETCFFF